MSITFTARELGIMSVLWDAGPSTVAEVRERLEVDQGLVLAYNSVLTFLGILEEKGYVAHSTEGRAFRYHALVGRSEASTSAVDRLLDELFGGSAGLLASHLIRDRKLNREEIERLRELLGDRLSDGTVKRTANRPRTRHAKDGK